MILFQAECQAGDFKSSLYQRKGDAVKAANKHIDASGGNHIVIVNEFFFPEGSGQIVNTHHLDS